MKQLRVHETRLEVGQRFRSAIDSDLYAEVVRDLDGGNRIGIRTRDTKGQREAYQEFGFKPFVALWERLPLE